MSQTPEKVLSTIAILYPEDLPSDLGGDCFELSATEKKKAWFGGKKDEYPHLDTQFAFKDAADVLSRLHFTIYYDPREGKWYVIDGGIYPGDQIQTPSKTGIWICSEGTNGQWGRVKGRAQITSGTRVYFAPHHRFMVMSSCYNTTVANQLWNKSYWDIEPPPPPQKITVEKAIRKDIEQSTPERQTTILGIVDEWGDDFRKPPKTKGEALYRVWLTSLLVITGLLVFWIWQGTPVPQFSSPHPPAEQTD